MNAQYIQSGQQLYKIDGIFNPNDKVLPIDCESSLINAILSINDGGCKPHLIPEEGSVSNVTTANSTSQH